MVSERRDSHAAAVTVAGKLSQSTAHPVMSIVKSPIPQRKPINPIATQSSRSIPQRIPSLKQLTFVADPQRKEGLLSQKQMEHSSDSAAAVVSLHLKYVQRAMALKCVDSIEREFLDQTPLSTLRRMLEKRIPLIGDWLVEIQVVSRILVQLAIGQASAARQREEELRIKQRQAKEQSRIALIFDFENRKLLLISDFQVSSLTPFLESHQTFFAQIAGFFIVEDRVLRIGDGLISKVEVDNLWDTAVSKMCSVFEDQFSRMQTANHLLLIKDYVSLLGVTLRRYGYPIDALLDVLSKHRDKYHASDCHKQISEDSYYVELKRTGTGAGALKSTLSGRTTPRGSPSFKRLSSGRTPRREARSSGINFQCFRSNRIVLWLLLITLWAYGGFYVQSRWAHGDNKESIFGGYDRNSSSVDSQPEPKNRHDVIANVDSLSVKVEVKNNHSSSKDLDLDLSTKGNSNSSDRNAGFTVYPSSGTYFVIVDHTPFGLKDDVAFCEYLIKEVGVVAIPTSVFLSKSRRWQESCKIYLLQR